MSRLTHMADRLMTQGLCLDWAARLIAGVPGPVLEIGLGKGRTYDHLREILPGREIFAFDRDVHAPPALVPDARHLILGDFRDTLPRVAATIGAAALAHADIGSDDRDADAELAAAVAVILADCLAPGAIVATDRAMDGPMDGGGWVALELPDGAGWPYFMYRVG